MQISFIPAYLSTSWEPVGCTLQDVQSGVSGGGIEREEEVGDTFSLPPISVSVESKGDILKQFISFDLVTE